VVKAGQRIKTVNYSFEKSDCYALQLDLQNGNLSRQRLFSNDDIPNSIPATATN